MNTQFSPRRSRAAFTLVEMLVVISIIVIMLAMAGQMINSDNGRNAVRSAATQLEGAMETARVKALSSGNQTAVLIMNRADDDRYLNFIMVVERQPKDIEKPDDEQWKWVPVSNGSNFAQGAFYWPREGVTFQEVFAGKGDLELGRAFQEYSKKDWIGLVFTPQGKPIGPGPLEQNPVFMIATGEISSTGLDVSDKQKLLAEAFMIQRSTGRIVPVEDPVDQLSL